MKRHTLRQFRAIKLAVHGGENYRTVDSVRSAAETLLERWPDLESEQFVTAIQACIDGMTDRIPPEAVREALIVAAREANISVID